jgi:hypothetical protein
MGRPEKPVDRTLRHRAALADYLRQVRREAELTYEDITVKVGTLASPATLKRAASGTCVPKYLTVLLFMLACSVEQADMLAERKKTAMSLWRLARREERGTLQATPRPQYVTDRADLTKALAALYETAGAPPLRMMQRLSNNAAVLPLSTLARIVNRETIPADEKQLLAFVHACGVSDRKAILWSKAWSKAAAKRPA